VKSVTIRYILPLAFVLFACDDEHEHHFSSFSECYAHEHDEEGASPEAAASDCDAELSISHTDRNDCTSDHAADVTAGVPQSAIDEHCLRTFP
jgi:hypothetical protein